MRHMNYKKIIENVLLILLSPITCIGTLLIWLSPLIGFLVIVWAFENWRISLPILILLLSVIWCINKIRDQIDERKREKEIEVERQAARDYCKNHPELAKPMRHQIISFSQYINSLGWQKYDKGFVIENDDKQPCVVIYNITKKASSIIGQSSHGVQTIESRQQEQFADSELDKNYKNIGVTIDMEAKEKTEEKKIDDFLGPDMDIGFRVAKFAFHHKVVLSADFAYLLHEIPTKIKDEEIDYKIDDDLQIVSYEILKGVWNEQYYPIVWYFPDWKSKDLLFFYDDHKKNPIVDRVLSGRIDPIDKLTQVYKELVKTKEIDAFVNECISCLKQ